MNVVHFSELSQDVRGSLQHQRWLVLSASELPHATAALAFSELEDVLVAVDHRHHHVEHGLWMRAVHLLIVDETVDAPRLQRESGISRVIVAKDDIHAHLW